MQSTGGCIPKAWMVTKQERSSILMSGDQFYHDSRPENDKKAKCHDDEQKSTS